MVATIGSITNFSTVAGYGGNVPDPNGVPMSAPGGTSSAVNITGTQVVKASAGRAIRFTVQNGGTTGTAWTLNDCTTVAAAATANQIYNSGTAALAVGTVVALDFPCISGIVVGSAPAGGQAALSFN